MGFALFALLGPLFQCCGAAAGAAYFILAAEVIKAN